MTRSFATILCLCTAVTFLTACTVDGPNEPRPTFVYDADGLMIPFPSDRYLEQTERTDPSAEKETGYRIVVEDYAETDPALSTVVGIAEGLSGLDGFGTSSEIAVATSASMEIGALASPDAAIAYSVADTSPVWLVSLGDEDAGERVPFLARLEPDGKTVFFRPWKPLEPNGWYALVLREGLADIHGRPFRSPAGFEENYRSGGGEGLEGEGYDRLRTLLAQRPVFATTFRTASISTRFERMVDEVRAGAAPPFTYTTRVPGSENPDVSLIVDGEFRHRSFRDDRGLLNDEVQREEWLKFTLTIPKVTAGHGEPFPVVLGQHGLGDRRQRVLELADGFARVGLGTIAIDAPNHGSRGPGDGENFDPLEGARSALGIWSDGGKPRFHAWYFRDLIRQQVLDHLQLLQVVENFDADLDRTDNQPGRDVAKTPAGYTGQSMGGIIGSVGNAVLTELPRVVLNVPGGRLSKLVLEHELLGDPLVMFLESKNITAADAYRMVAMAQATIDPGDPINYVHRIAADPVDEPRPLLMQGAFEDATLANATTFDLARVADTPLAGPWMHPIPGLETMSVPNAGLDGNDARAFFFFREVKRDGETVRATHGNVWGSETALEQAATFLSTGVIQPPQ